MRLLLALFVVLLTYMCVPAVLAQNEAESTTKWTLVQQFVEQITYPEAPDSLRRDASAPFVIGILGENPFKAETTKAQKNGLTLKGRSVQIVSLSGVSAIRDIDVLIIGRDYESKAYYATRAAQKAPILTIGDTRAMSTQGAMISFLLENNAVKFHINTQLLAERGFNPDIKLLRLTQ